MRTTDVTAGSRRPGFVALAAGSTVALAALVFAASGVSKTTAPGALSASCLKTAQAAVAKAKAAPPAPAIPKLPGRKLAGKHFTLILSGGTPYTFSIADGFKEAAKVAGADATIFSGSREVGAWNQSISTAVAQGTNGLVLLAVSPKLVSNALSPAISAKTPIIDSFDEGPSAARANGIAANVDLDQAREGKIEADWILANSGCKANVLIPTLPGYVATGNLTSNATTEISSRCPSCNVYSVQINISKLATDLPLQISTALLQHPDINYVLAPFDAAVPYILPAIQERSSRAKIVGSNGLPGSIKMIADGSGPQVADFASAPGPFVGWQLFNKLAQALTLGTVKNEKIPDRLLDSKNIRAGLVPASLRYYKKAYKKAWGIGG